MQIIHVYTDSELALITEYAAKGCTMASIAQAIGVSKSSFFRDYNNPALGVKKAYDLGFNEARSDNHADMDDIAGDTESKERVKALMAIREDIVATKIQNAMDEIDYYRENEDL